MSVPGSPCKIAVIGAGLIGERHARLVADTTATQLCAIIDPTDSARKLSSSLFVNHHETIAEFMANAGDCDAAIIATPNDSHREIAVSLIERGIPCLVEKPLAANSADALAIVEASECSQVPVLVGHHRRHHHASYQLKHKIEHDALGRIVGAQLTWALRKPEEYFAAGDWRVRKGGGPVWINLIHEIDLLRFFIGEIVEVSAMLANAVRGNAVEDSGVINIRFENNALASIFIADATPAPWHFEGGSGENPNIAQTGKDGLRLFGTKGAITFPSLTMWKHETQNGHWGNDIIKHGSDDTPAMDGEVALTNQLANFVAVINGEAAPLVSARDGLQTVRIVEAIHLSAHAGRNVHIETNNNHQKHFEEELVS